MIPGAKAFNLKKQRLWLLPQKALYWQKKKVLMLADLHIGKSGHFRKHGIPVPGEVNRSNLKLMDRLVSQIEPEHLIILGDLFHSDVNKEWNEFAEWREKHTQIEVSLVIGNHDILPASLYHSSRLNLFGRLTIPPFILVHDLNEMPNQWNGEQYVLSGHIHPAVRLKGRGRQSLKLPCFYFGKKEGILPAFGSFTGTHIIEAGAGDKIFTIVESKILSVGS